MLRYYKNETKRYYAETKKGKNTMNEKIYYSAEDIAKMLGVSMGKSYKILREMNKELAGKDNERTLGGKAEGCERANTTKIYAYTGTWHIEKTQYQYRIVIRGKRGCL
jgi:transposase|nr:MAG TPA: hypothetical protein [Caudoviricetes sp.]